MGSMHHDLTRSMVPHATDLPSATLRILRSSNDPPSVQILHPRQPKGCIVNPRHVSARPPVPAVLIDSVCLHWSSTLTAMSCGSGCNGHHDHSTGHGHGHDHGHYHGHDHGHDHSHDHKVSLSPCLAFPQRTATLCWARWCQPCQPDRILTDPGKCPSFPQHRVGLCAIQVRQRQNRQLARARRVELWLSTFRARRRHGTEGGRQRRVKGVRSSHSAGPGEICAILEECA